MDKKARPTRRILEPKGTVKLLQRAPSTATQADVVTATQEQSQRIVHLLLAVINTIEDTANEQINTRSMHQRLLPLRDVRMYASMLKRTGALLDKIIAERVSQLPSKKVTQ